MFLLLTRCLTSDGGGYWHQRADERLGDPHQRWIQEPLVVRDRDGRLELYMEDPI